MPADLREAIDQFASSCDEPTSRSEAIRAILADWLRTHGFMKQDDHPEPQGPATDAVREMDEAITQHRKARQE